MTNVAVFPSSVFFQVIDMLTNAPDRKVYSSIGLCKKKASMEYLIRASLSHQIPEYGQYIVLSIVSERIDIANWLNILTDGAACAISFLPSTGEWWGSVMSSQKDLLPLDKIKLIGPQMDSFIMSDFGLNENKASVTQMDPSLYKQFSRTIGVLGKEPWEKLTSLTMAIIGCGRSGSLAATTLVKSGVRNLILIDPDVVEIHNVPEMDGITAKDVGTAKVEALASFLKTMGCRENETLNIVASTSPIYDAHCLALEADVLISCVDNDAARMNCAIIASLYHKILLDIGTGILPGTQSDSPSQVQPDRKMGADMRIIIPGGGCLLCLGGVADYENAMKELAGFALPSNEPWWVERFGSLRTLNMTAVHIALQLLLEFLSGQISQSTWLQMEYQNEGNIILHNNQEKSNPTICPLCSKAGLGDWGIFRGNE